MRIALCVRHQQKIFRLVWINESKAGIYIGALGTEQDTHFSYHQDGKRHLKIGDEELLPFSDIPLASHKGIKQLSHFSISLTKNWLNDNTAYAGDKRTETIIFLDERLFYDKDTLALDFWLLDHGSENELLKIVSDIIDANPKFQIISELVSTLNNFPDKKIALTLRSARIRETSL